MQPGWTPSPASKNTNWYITIFLSHSFQFSSVTQSCPTLCDPMNCSTSGLPVHHQLPEPTQTHVHWVGEAIQPSHDVIPVPSCPQSFPESGSFQRSQLFASGGQSIGVWASASVLPVNIQCWFPLGLTGLLSSLGSFKSCLKVLAFWCRSCKNISVLKFV